MSEPEQQVQQWLEQAVIGLNLCPFARKPLSLGRVRFTVCNSRHADQLLQTLHDELQLLAETPTQQWETTLLIITEQLDDFLDFNDFLDLADALLAQQDWDGIFQVASFHPRYQFAGTAADDVENFTNRAPYPILHLLREDSISAAVDSYPQVDEIPERNIRTLQTCSPAQLASLFPFLADRGQP